ncbi:MAG TPA: phosphoribosylglycinamide formyltransferase [Gammaproteobacteria bacterium]|nr:phosphoribosylglycinamide formyltransferase [Gammaproteobacteria bacterium]
MIEGERLPLVVLASGRGSNLQAIIDAAADGRLAARIAAVVSDRADALALQRAREAGIFAQALLPRDFPDPAAYDAALAASVGSHRPGLVVLAGFMRIIGGGFVRRFTGRMLNIHPSLLPKYPGLDTHRRVLEAGERETGASVHFVTEAVDAGPLIARARLPVRPGDTAQTLAARVLEFEHLIYPQVIDWFATGRLRMRDGRAWLDGRALDKPIAIRLKHTSQVAAS